VEFERSGTGDEGALRPRVVIARRRPPGVAAVRTGRGGGRRRGGVLDPLFEEPAGEVAGQLHGATLQVIEARHGGVGVRGEETLEDGVGVLLPLLPQGFPISGSGHGYLGGQDWGAEVIVANRDRRSCASGCVQLQIRNAQLRICTP
jgi:hypothetical protein